MRSNEISFTKSIRLKFLLLLVFNDRVCFTSNYVSKILRYEIFWGICIFFFGLGSLMSFLCGKSGVLKGDILMGFLCWYVLEIVEEVWFFKRFLNGSRSWWG